MDNFKVIIAGSRGFSNYKLLREQCNKFLREKRKTSNIIIVSGHARGADALGEKYAQDEGFALEIYPAQWKKLGKQAGYSGTLGGTDDNVDISTKSEGGNT